MVKLQGKKIIYTNHVKDRLIDRKIDINKVNDTLIKFNNKDITSNKIMIINHKEKLSLLIENLSNKIKLVTVINDSNTWTKKDTIKVYV